MWIRWHFCFFFKPINKINDSFLALCDCSIKMCYDIIWFFVSVKKKIIYEICIAIYFEWKQKPLKIGCILSGWWRKAEQICWACATTMKIVVYFILYSHQSFYWSSMNVNNFFSEMSIEIVYMYIHNLGEQISIWIIRQMDTNVVFCEIHI